MIYNILKKLGTHQFFNIFSHKLLIIIKLGKYQIKDLQELKDLLHNIIFIKKIMLNQ